MPEDGGCLQFLPTHGFGGGGAHPFTGHGLGTVASCVCGWFFCFPRKARENQFGFLICMPALLSMGATDFSNACLFGSRPTSSKTEFSWPLFRALPKSLPLYGINGVSDEVPLPVILNVWTCVAVRVRLNSPGTLTRVLDIFSEPPMLVFRFDSGK